MIEFLLTGIIIALALALLVAALVMWFLIEEALRHTQHVAELLNTICDLEDRIDNTTNYKALCEYADHLEQHKDNLQEAFLKRGEHINMLEDKLKVLHITHHEDVEHMRALYTEQGVAYDSALNENAILHQRIAILHLAINTDCEHCGWIS